MRQFESQKCKSHSFVKMAYLPLIAGFIAFRRLARITVITTTAFRGSVLLLLLLIARRERFL